MDQIIKTQENKNQVNKSQITKLLILIFMVIYIISPDLVPGPVDDLIVFLLSMAAQKGIKPTE